MRILNSNKRVFLLVACLLISSILLVLGLGFLTTKANDLKAAKQVALTAQARSLAWAGLERTRTKLEKDAHYPPPGSEEQLLYSYSEEILDPSGQPVGSYTVVLDQTHVQEPYYRLKIRCTGRVGQLTSPQSRYTLTAELDLDEASPRYFQLFNLRDPSF